jgi:hypothetical protein
MGRVGEQHLVRVDQAFDSSGSLIEALSQTCNLVAALDLDARGKIAGSQRLDAALQPLEPSREPPHDGAGAESDHKGDRAKEGRKHQRAGALPGRQPRNQPPPVRERYRNCGPGGRSHPTAAPTVATGSGKRPTRRGQWLVGAAEQRQVRAETLSQMVDRLLLRLRRRIGRGDQLSDDFAGNLELLAEWAKACNEVPKQTRREHDQDEARYDGEIYLQIKSSHPSLPVDAGSLQSDASVLGFGEHIAGAADRDHASRLFGIVLDRGPDARDMHVD